MSATGLLSRLSGCILLVGIVALGACATGGMGGAAEGSTGLEVQNNLIPPTALTIYLVPEIGTRRMIGSVQPGATRVVRFDPISASGQYQFVAETTFGRDIVSNPVTFRSGDSIRWDVSANLAVVTGS